MKWSGNRIEIKNALLRQSHLDSLAVTGKTLETGEGDKSPDNPYTLAGTTTLTVSDGGNQSQTIALPRPLYSLPDGTIDSYDVVSGSGTQRVGKVVFAGNNFSYRSDVSTTLTACFRYTPTALMVSSTTAICDKFICNTSTSDTEHLRLTTIAGYVFNIFVLKSRMPGWDDGLANTQKTALFTTWLAANPVTVLYELATPKAISGEAQTIPTYYPYTQIINDAGGGHGCNG